MNEPGLGRDVARDQSVSVTASRQRRPGCVKLAGESEEPPAELLQMGRIRDEHGLGGAAECRERGPSMRIGQSFAGGALAATRRHVSTQDLHDLRRNGGGYGWAAPSEHVERYRINFRAAVWCSANGRLVCDDHSAKLRGMTSLG